MSVRLVHPETDASPAEYEYTSPAECLVCGEEHDLDDDTGRLRVEGWPGDEDAVVCDIPPCVVFCAECLDWPVVERQSEFDRNLIVRDETIWYDGEPYCPQCFAALLGAEY